MKHQKLGGMKMRKTTFLSLFTLLLTLVLASSVSAKENKIPDWFVEIPQNSMLTATQKSGFTQEQTGDFTKENNKYFFFHNNGNSLDSTKVDEFIDGEVDLQELEDFNVLGIGKYEVNGKVYTDFIFSNLPEENYSDILEDSLNNAQKVYNPISENSTFQTLASSKDYLDSYTFNVYNGTTLAGVYTSNVDYLYKGLGNLSGKTVSVWDVKYFNQSEPRSGYQTREIITRFEVSPWVNQTLRSYGPTTTGKNTSASISLSGIVPTLSWNFNTYSSSVIDNSSISDKYARWIFKPALGSSTAENSYIMKPGARVTNSSGNIGFKTTHNMDYYMNLNSQKVYNTGGLTRYLADL